jgi:tetratricopeptide (TPR) repeat protein
MTPEALEGIFVQREDLARAILERVRESATTASPLHTLLVGPRGIGKTYLICLIYHRLREMEDLHDQLVLAWLREEEFGATSFPDLLLRTLRALVAEHKDNNELAGRLQALCNLSPDKVESAALQLLRSLVQGRILLILMENLDDLFQRLGGQGQAQLQRFLRENRYCSILASSRTPLESMPSPGAQSGGVFLVHKLEELSYEESVSLLSKIAEYRGDRRLSAFISTPEGMACTRALRYLAGGNHRAHMIFSQLLARESPDDLIEPLMRTIDDLTPYYESRMAWLSEEQKKIIAFISECRRPVPAHEIARHCFVNPEATPLSLEILHKLDLLNAISVGAETYYELREPLMRPAGEAQKDRGKPVLLLMDFLRLWYAPAGLQQRLASLPPDAALERAYAVPGPEATRQEREHPLVPSCCREYNTAIQKGDFGRALQAAEELVAIRGASQDLFAQASCLRSLGRHGAALALYDRIIAAGGSNALAWTVRGSTLYKLGQYQEALGSYAKAVEIDPDAGRAWSDRGAILLCTGNPKQALASLEKAIQLDREDSYAWMSRGMALSELGCHEEALSSFTRAAELEPQDAMPHISMGAALIELKRWDQALAHADVAANLNSDQPLAWALRGMALAALRRHSDALASLNRAFELGEESSFVYFKRAQLLLSQNRWREGSAVLDEALARFAHSNNPDAGDTAELIRLAQRALNDEKQLQPRVKVLVLLYYRHRALNALGRGLVEGIPDVLSPTVNDASLRRWLDQWQALAGRHPEFSLPLRLLGSAVSWRATQDLQVLMQLPPEERVLLEPLLGVELQDTSS